MGGGGRSLALKAEVRGGQMDRGIRSRFGQLKDETKIKNTD